MNIKKIASVTASFALVASIVLASSASADSTNKTGASNEQGRGNFQSEYNRGGMMGVRQGMKPAVVGKVSAVNGNTITVTGRQNSPRPEPSSGSTTPPPATATITYTVDATNAIVLKNNATSTVSSITVGDMIMVQGTVSGTNVVATNIRDNTPGGTRGLDGKKDGRPGTSTSTPPAFVGNGQPIVAGKIATVNGNTLTITTASNITYTVDATNAKFLKGKDTITVSGVVVGDTVIVQGAISGSTVTASTVLDKTVVNPVNTQGNNGNGGGAHAGGFFKGIGNFFMKMFGF